MTNIDFNQNGFPKMDSPFVQPNRHIEIPWYRLLITLWNRSGGSSGGQVVPTGMIMDWAGPVSTVPSGWLVCDGSTVSRAAYDALFSAIGTTWGAGDGATTFRLPDFRNRYRKGTSGSPAVGTYSGSSSFTIAVNQIPQHAHGLTDPGHVHAIVDPGHTHGQSIINSNTAGTAGTQGASAANNATAGTTATGMTGITGTSSAFIGISATDPVGNGDPISFDPPNGAVLTVIKT